MRRILFVDDESRVLEGLERLLYRYRSEWDMTFVGSGAAALERLAEAPYDVLVTDMRMPGVDGPALLKAVQVSHPSLIRIVLTGHTELEAGLRAMPLAHQFLCKPCDPKVLMTVLERACGLRALLDDERIRELVGGMGDLPTRPRVYSELVAALADENASAARIASIVERDVALTSKLIHVVNSAHFSPKQRVSDVRGAVTLIGSTMLRHLVLSIEVFQSGPLAVPGFSMDELNRHAVLVGSVAKRVHGSSSNDAFLAGMLHDVGQIVLAVHLPDYFGRVLREMRSSGRSMVAVEHELRNVTHAEIGAYLLGLWGMPYPVIEAVAHHHTPDRNLGRGLDVTTAVQIANALVHEVDGSTSPFALDGALLSSLGVNDDLQHWREVTATIVNESHD